MKWRSPIFLTVATLIIGLLVASGAYLALVYHEPATYQEMDTIVPTFVPTASSQPITPNITIQKPEHRVTTESPVVVPNTTSISPAPTQSITGWKVYTNKEYKFEIQYPPKDWLLTSKIQGPLLSYNPREEPVHLYTQRFIPAMGGQSAPIALVIYDKPSNTSMAQWLSEGYGMDFEGIQEGDLETALARAYESEESAIVSYREYENGDTNVFEVGAVLDNSLIFIYATFFTKDNLPYVYEISFDLAYYGPEWKAEPSDSDYIELYKQIVATFKFTD